ncbi:MAG: 4'-phosphopantetheinyl transferase superfamily protein [Lautropia sp.]|nr:4'-phosphopantetheinyl transferase superfamily protein [Lautropia sp.]
MLSSSLPTPDAPIPPDPIRLVCYRIDLDAPLPDGALQCLSAEEAARAERFRFEHLRQRYRASRVALRTLLAEQLSVAPAEIRFTTSATGKPSLHPDHGSTLHFNLSHSEGSGWIALAHQPVGIDVEAFDRPMPERATLVERIASATEQTLMQQLPTRWQGPAFFLAWTRKEALLKAWGDGIQGFGSLQRLDTRLPDSSGTEYFLEAAMVAGRADSQDSPNPLPTTTQNTVTQPDTALSFRALPVTQIHHPQHRPDANANRQPLWLASFAGPHEIISVAAPVMFSVELHAYPLPVGLPKGNSSVQPSIPNRLFTQGKS